MSQQNQCPQCGAELPTSATQGLCPKCLMEAGLESQDQAQSQGAGDEPAATTPSPKGFIPPRPEELAPHFPQLEILELLGRGGMGAVYKARQPKLDRLVALKIIKPESVDDPAFAERFMREARTLARLNHPNIVAVHEFGEADQLYYFIMEYVEGQNIRQMLAAGQLEPKAALAIVPQVCEALQFAHDEGVVHRDIKPENILVDRNGRVKIADFGLAKLAADAPGDVTLTGTHQVMGTPRYMAPEQMEGSRRVDHRADIFSLGVVFYEMLTGELPIGQFEPPSQKVEIDVRLDEVVLRSLAKEPQRRYQQASEVKNDIESISQSKSSRAGRSSLAEAPAASGSHPRHTRTFRMALARYTPLFFLAGNMWLAATIALLLGKKVARTEPLMYSFFDVGAWVYPATYNLWIWCCALVAVVFFIFSWQVHGAAHRPAHRTDRETKDRPPGTIQRAWNEWWSQRDAFFTRTVQTMLVLFHLACLFMFLGTRVSIGWHEGGQTFAYYIGSPSPWFINEVFPEPDTPFRQRIDLLSSSMLVAALGFLAYYIFWRIEKVKRPTAGFFRSPQFILMIWLLMGGCGVGMGIRKGQSALAGRSTPPGDLSVEADEDFSDAPLLRAAAYGQVGRIRQLLAEGADVNDKDGGGRTALIVAAANGQVSTAKTLILLGAEVNERDNRKMTATMHAAENGHNNVIGSFFELINTIGIVRHELESEHDDGFDAGGDDSPGDRPPPAPKPRPDVRTLLRDRLSGVDVQLFEDVHFRLPQFDVDTSAQDVLGQTAMMKAAIGGHSACIEHLHPWDTSTVRDRDGRTALMHAVVNGQAQFLRDVMAGPSTGMGTSVGNYIHNALLSPEAMSVTDLDGKTALQLAIENEDDEIAELLRGELNRAIDHFTRAIEVGGPYHFTYYRQRGYAHRALGDDEKADADLKEAGRLEIIELRQQQEQDLQDSGGGDAAQDVEDEADEPAAPSDERPMAVPIP